MSVMDIKATVEIVEDDPAGCDTLALRSRRLTMAVCFIAILAGLLLDGDVEVFALHLVGLGVGGLPFMRFTPWRKIPSHKR